MDESDLTEVIGVGAFMGFSAMLGPYRKATPAAQDRVAELADQIFHCPEDWTEEDAEPLIGEIIELLKLHELEPQEPTGA